MVIFYSKHGELILHFAKITEDPDIKVRYTMCTFVCVWYGSSDKCDAVKWNEPEADNDMLLVLDFDFVKYM